MTGIQLVKLVRVGNERKLLLRDRLNMTREVFGRVVNVSPRAIATVEQEEAAVAKLARPYADQSVVFSSSAKVAAYPSCSR